LAPEGFSVSEARNGYELMTALEAAVPDLITLDLNLGGEDGLKLARDVRSRWNVPIIMVTGKAIPSTASSDLSLGR
jgi:DNA-binding response OmpR family regulator